MRTWPWRAAREHPGGVEPAAPVRRPARRRNGPGPASLSSSLYSGAICLLLDPRQHTHPWAYRLPNVAYPQDVRGCGAALEWLADEISRRNQILAATTDFTGYVHGGVGPRIVVLADNPPLLLRQLQRWWDGQRAEDRTMPRICPPLEAFHDAMYASIDTNVSVLAIGQPPPAQAPGRNESREIVAGARILGHPSPQLWDRFASPHPYPAGVSTRRGRVYTVTVDTVTETQLALVTCQEAHDLALAGTVTTCPPGMPGRHVPQAESACPITVGPAAPRRP